MIRPASIGNLAALVSLCAAVEAVPLDSLKADARRLLAPPRLHLVLAGMAMGGLATRIDDRLEWELPGGGISSAAFDLAGYYGSTGKTAAAGAVLWTLAGWREADGLRTQSEEVLRSIAAAALIVAPPEACYPQAPAGRGRQAVVSIRSHSHGICPFIRSRPSPWFSDRIAGVRVGDAGACGARR